MIGDLPAILALPAVQNAIVAVLVASVTMPIVGVFIIGLDIIPVRFAMMHVALLGIAIGLILSVDPTLCAVLLCAAAGASLAPLARGRTGLSGPMGFLMTIAIALALLTLSISGVNATGAFEWLWGSLLAVRVQELWLLCALGIAIIGVFARYRKQLALLLFDEELAQASGVNTRYLATILLIVVAVAIAMALPLTGALLVDALTFLPALAARNLAISLGSMVILAVLFGLIGNVSGFALSIALDQPPGPILVLTSGFLTLCTFIFGRSK